jgi:CDP-diacylglycerol---serine O-phosphatidyltransferase
MTSERPFPKPLIPGAITAAAIFAGYVAIVQTFQGDYLSAAWFILIACFLDMFDGRVARMINASSDFGVQFDSLADVVNYGLAPALLFYLMYFQEWGYIGMALGFLPLCCAAVRLARFNVQAEETPRPSCFDGLPTTMAACLLAGFVIFVSEFSSVPHVSSAAALLVVMVALLMVSNVPYQKIKIVSPHQLIPGTIVLLTFLLFPRAAFFLWGLLYVVYGLVRSVFLTLKGR